MSDLTRRPTANDLRTEWELEHIIGSPHSPECWRWHRECALLIACDELERNAARITELEARLAAAGDDPCPECEGTGVRHR